MALSCDLTTREQEWVQRVKTELGEPIVSVELDDCAWPTILERAKLWYTAKKGVLGCTNIQLQDQVYAYDFPENAWAIVDVIFPQRSDIQSLLSLGFFDIVPLNALNIGAVTSAFNSYSAYTQILQALETRRRVFGAEPGWEIICDKLHVFGHSCSGEWAGIMLVVYKKKEWSTDVLMGRDENLFFRYFVAQAKYFLGRIRSKYKSYPAAGGPIDTDGPELIEEAKTEIEKLDEEIADSQGPMGMIIA